MEIEWQFDASDLEAVEAWLREAEPYGGLIVRAHAAKQLHDTYLETSDWRVHRAGYALRLRETRDAVEATLKALAGAAQDGGPRRRAEYSERVIGFGPEAVDAACGPVGSRVRVLGEPADLAPLFEVRTWRRTFALERGSGEIVGEVALDESDIGSPARGWSRLRRVEVEVVDPSALEALESWVERLAEACELGTAGPSKFEVGLQRLSSGPPGPPPPLRVGSKTTIGELILGAMRQQLWTVIANEPATRMGDDPEGLHDMRVAIRRLRSAIRCFGPVLPPSARNLDPELRWLASVLGEVRDVDVQLEQLEAWRSELLAAGHEAEAQALRPVATMYRDARLQRRRELLAALSGARCRQLLIDGVSNLRDSNEDASAELALTAAPPLVREQWRRFKRAARRLRAAERRGDQVRAARRSHRLRIEAKRLRYTAEFVEPLYGKPARRLTSVLRRVQDALGEQQDAVVAKEQLASLAEGTADLPSETRAALRLLERRYDELLVTQRQRAPKVIRRVRPRWRALRRAARKARS